MQITLSYIEVAEPIEKRRAELKSTFFFECQCPRCTSDKGKELDRAITGVKESIDRNVLRELKEDASKLIEDSKAAHQAGSN